MRTPVNFSRLQILALTARLNGRYTYVSPNVGRLVVIRVAHPLFPYRITRLLAWRWSRYLRLRPQSKNSQLSRPRGQPILLLGHKMKHSMSTVLLLILVATPGFAQGTLEFPSLGAKILEKQFPKFDKTNVTLTSLRRYRTELEYFRDEVLEGYNTAVREYVAELGQFDTQLERARKNGEVSEVDYKRMHQHLVDEYEKAGPKGELLKPYFTYLKKYQSEATFVIHEINNKEKELMKF